MPITSVRIVSRCFVIVWFVGFALLGSHPALAKSSLSIAAEVMERPLPRDEIPNFLDTDFVFAEPTPITASPAVLASPTLPFLTVMATGLVLLLGLLIVWRHQRRTHHLLRQALDARQQADTIENLSWDSRFMQACTDMLAATPAQRVQALHVLESLAHDGALAATRVVQHLVEFIRQTAPWPVAQASKALSGSGRQEVAMALQVLGRIRRAYPELELPVDLSRVDLAGVSIQRGDFRHVKWHDTNLNGATFRDCDFSGSEFWHANLALAVFQECRMKDVSFLDAGHGTPLSAREKMARALLHGADLSSCTGLNRRIFAEAHITRATRLPAALQAPARRVLATLPS